MRILHTSDWHLGKSLENRNRLQEQRAFIDELCDLVEQKEVNLVLIAGDVFDTYTPSAAAEELFYEAVDRLNGKGQRAVVVIAGNHDSPERLCAARALSYKNGIILVGYPASDPGTYGITNPNIRIADSGAGWLELSIAGCKHHAVILTLPYPSESRLAEVLSRESSEELLQQAYSDRIKSIFAGLSEKFRDDTVNLVVSHLFIRGGKESESERPIQMGGALTVAPDALPGNAHYIALGHLHRPQKVNHAPSPTRYSGSPLAYSFSETDYRKAVYVIEAVAGREAEIETVYLNAGKPLKRWVAQKGVEEALKWCEEGKDANAWIDLEIRTDNVLTTEEQKKLRELHPGILNIRPKIHTEQEQTLDYENRETKRIDELFKDYYQFRMGVEISEELMDTFLEVLNNSDKDDEEDGIFKDIVG